MKQYRGLIIFFLAATSLFVLAQVWHAQSAPEEIRQERERQLKGLAIILNVQSGKISDDGSTRMDSVTYSDEVMSVSHTLIKVAKNEIDVDQFTRDARALVVSALCTEKGLGQFVKTGLSINVLFKDSTGSPIVEFHIGKSDCL